MTKKRCGCCGKFLPLSSFWKGNSKYGRHAYCKACHLQNNTEWRLKNPVAGMLSDAKRRAKRRGVPFNITAEDIQIPTVCPILGIPLEPNHDGTNLSNPNSPSLDCVDPTLGYVKGNVWVISHRANRIKNNATAEELMLVATKVYERTYCADFCAVPTQP